MRVGKNMVRGGGYFLRFVLFAFCKGELGSIEMRILDGIRRGWRWRKRKIRKNLAVSE